MNAMKKKLRSRKGASMTFALLIFLICAVVSATVVVASSAAAGRMSERAAADQRYYAVTSAAGLLKSDFDGVKATVEYTRTGTDATVTPATTGLTKGGAALTPGDCALISDASARLVSKLAGNTLDPANRAFTLSCGATTTGAKLDCELVEYVDAGKKQLTYEIHNQTEAGGGKQAVYTVCVTFNANVSQSESQVMLATGVPQTRVTTTVEWTLGSIRKGAYSG